MGASYGKRAAAVYGGRERERRQDQQRRQRLRLLQRGVQQQPKQRAQRGKAQRPPRKQAPPLRALHRRACRLLHVRIPFWVGFSFFLFFREKKRKNQRKETLTGWGLRKIPRAALSHHSLPVWRERKWAKTIGQFIPNVPAFPCLPRSFFSFGKRKNALSTIARKPGCGTPGGFHSSPFPIRFLFFGSFFSFPERKERTEKIPIAPRYFASTAQHRRVPRPAG